MSAPELRQLLLDNWIITPNTFKTADEQTILEIAYREGFADRAPDPYVAQRHTDMETAAREMSGDDGDALPSGRYEVGADGELERVGDTEVLDRYHGTPQYDVISDFRASPAGFTDGGRAELNDIPAVYTTDSADIAEQYAYGVSVNARPMAGRDPQLYSLALTPSEIVEAGDCEDDDAVALAASLGADVLECPDFGEQPETVVLDDRVIHVKEATNLDTGAPLLAPPKTRSKKMAPVNNGADQNPEAGKPAVYDIAMVSPLTPTQPNVPAETLGNPRLAMRSPARTKAKKRRSGGSAGRIASAQPKRPSRR